MLIPLIKQLRNSSIERQKLTQLRAVLLPKLMSGEIDASKVELPTPPTQTAPTNGRLTKILELAMILIYVAVSDNNECCYPLRIAG